MTVGFVPCFAYYLHKDFPIENVFEDTSFVSKIKLLFATMFDNPQPQKWKEFLGGKLDIQPIRAESSEFKRIINLCHSPYQLYRLDFGNTPFRVVLALENQPKIAYFYMLDTKHQTVSGKHRKSPKGNC